MHKTRSSVGNVQAFRSIRTSEPCNCEGESFRTTTVEVEIIMGRVIANGTSHSLGKLSEGT